VVCASLAGGGVADANFSGWTVMQPRLGDADADGARFLIWRFLGLSPTSVLFLLLILRLLVAATVFVCHIDLSASLTDFFCSIFVLLLVWIAVLSRQQGTSRYWFTKNKNVLRVAAR
jgi:hypothetical protein